MSEQGVGARHLSRLPAVAKQGIRGGRRSGASKVVAVVEEEVVLVNFGKKVEIGR
jgi:hypothetical protein